MRRSLVAVALALSCGGGAATRPSGGRDETPSWLAEGTGAFRAEGQKRLQGVGVASGVADPRARRRQADAAAREQLQVVVDALAQGLPGSAQDRAAAAEIARKAGAQAASIRDHWVTPDGDERALGVIDLDAFKRALQNVDGDEGVKGEMFSNIDRAFDQAAGAR